MPVLRSTIAILWGTTLNPQRTTNDGATWAAVASMAADSDGGIFWHPTNPAICYAHHPAAVVANRRKVWKSTDFAATFAPVNNDLTGVRVNRSIGVLPSGRILCGLSSEVAPNDQLSIVYTDDEGATATVVQVAAIAAHARHHCMTPITGNIVIMLGLNNVAYRSIDGGATWTAVLTATLGRFLDFIYLDPQTGFVFIVEVHQATTNPYIIWRSTNQGASFVNVDSALKKTGDANQPLRSMIVRADAGLLYFLGSGVTPTLRQSSDNGATWAAYVPGLDVRRAAYRTTGALISLNNTTGFIARSTNNGGSWADTATGFGAGYIRDFASFLRVLPGGGLSKRRGMGFLLNARIRKRRPPPR